MASAGASGSMPTAKWGQVPFVSAESTFNRLSMTERSKLRSEVTSNVAGQRLQDSACNGGQCDATSASSPFTLLGRQAAAACPSRPFKQRRSLREVCADRLRSRRPICGARNVIWAAGRRRGRLLRRRNSYRLIRSCSTSEDADGRHGGPEPLSMFHDTSDPEKAVASMPFSGRMRRRPPLATRKPAHDHWLAAASRPARWAGPLHAGAGDQPPGPAGKLLPACSSRCRPATPTSQQIGAKPCPAQSQARFVGHHQVACCRRRRSHTRQAQLRTPVRPRFPKAEGNRRPHGG